MVSATLHIFIKGEGKILKRFDIVPNWQHVEAPKREQLYVVYLGLGQISADPVANSNNNQIPLDFKTVLEQIIFLDTNNNVIPLAKNITVTCLCRISETEI